MNPNEELVLSIKQKIGRNKKKPKIGWRRSGGLPFLPIEDSKMIFINKIEELVKLVIRAHYGKPKDKTIVAKKLTYGCAEVLLDERCFENIQEFELHEDDIYDMAIKAAEDIVNNKKDGENIDFFKTQISSFHRGNDMYTKLKNVLDVSEIPAEMLRRIQDAVHHYHISSHVYLDSPNESQIEASLLWLVNGYQKSDNEFQDRFKRLDALTKDRLAQVDLPDNLDIMNADEVDPSRVLDIIDKAIDSINKDRTKQKMPTGPLKQLIYNLCFIYEEIIGQKPKITYYGHHKDAPHFGFSPYRGQFYDFLVFVLGLIHPDQHIHNPTLGSHIKKIISLYNWTTS